MLLQLNFINVSKLELCSTNEFTIIPKNLVNLINLTELNLNHISNLIKSNTLILCDNKISKMSRNIGYMTDLHTLVLTNNNIEIIPKNFKYLMNLYKLDISSMTLR